MIYAIDVHRSVIEVNPDVLEIADALDGERDEGKIRGSLHGIPFLVKDVRILEST